jgi:hypothetical protein
MMICNVLASSWSVGSWGAVWEVTMAIEPTKTTNNPANPIWDVDPFGLYQLSVTKNPFAVNGGNVATAMSEYLVDAFQRTVLFLDVLRRRGNDEEEMSSRPMATVLHFDHQVLMTGQSLSKPINFSLSRIVPPAGVVIDPHKRPVVVVDPRAGQGPGIGGFKVDSEIGDALNFGHPVYFIHFTATPEPGQQFLDIVEGQVKFFEHVVALHPDAPRPFAIGNCQAGYQTLMVAMLRPDLFGPCMVAGSPLSYWQGVRGKNPMRYSGGLLGGSWLTALTSDLGKGKFDGTWLVLNFDNLSPSNWLWDKQYDLYANVDKGADRYLEFEHWWGDFIDLNGDEMQFIVDELFVGDKLTRNQIKSSDGGIFDLRNITSPLIVFTSQGDNISPPQQTLGWILDLYRDVNEIRASGQTIVYCMNQKVGHLAIFVSAKVGAKEDEEMVRLMDMIDCLPPGLYELIISPRPADASPHGSFVANWVSRFEARTLDDIRALGRNSGEDDRAFATVARMSELTHSIYRTFWQPMVRALANQPAADLAHRLNPLRLSYTLFADSNPLMKGLPALADQVKANRKAASPDNPFLVMQKQVSDQITTALDMYRDARDRMVEQFFFGIYGSPVVQGLLGINTDEKVRELPGITPEKLATRKQRMEAYAAKLASGGFAEALTRAALYVAAADRAVDERCAAALAAAFRELKGVRARTRMSVEQFKALVRDQFFVLLIERERAVEALAKMVPEADQRATLLKRINAIVNAGAPPTPAESVRIAHLSQILSTPPDASTSVAAE